MSLRGVPDDELEEICILFDKQAISYYVTPAGNWHISAGAIWLDDQEQLEQVHDLLNKYQLARYQRTKGEFSERQKKGECAGLVGRIFENPVRFIGYLIIIGFIVYISVMPFVDFGK